MSFVSWLFLETFHFFEKKINRFPWKLFLDTVKNHQDKSAKKKKQNVTAFNSFMTKFFVSG